MIDHNVILAITRFEIDYLVGDYTYIYMYYSCKHILKSRSIDNSFMPSSKKWSVFLFIYLSIYIIIFYLTFIQNLLWKSFKISSLDVINNNLGDGFENSFELEQWLTLVPTTVLAEQGPDTLQYYSLCK